MIVYLMNVDDEPVEHVFLNTFDVNKYIEEYIQTMEEYCRIDVFKVDIPDDIPGDKRHETALIMLLKKKELIESELDAMSNWENPQKGDPEMT